jgi:hypothetical protein
VQRCGGHLVASNIQDCAFSDWRKPQKGTSAKSASQPIFEYKYSSFFDGTQICRCLTTCHLRPGKHSVQLGILDMDSVQISNSLTPSVAYLHFYIFLQLTLLFLIMPASVLPVTQEATGTTLSPPSHQETRTLHEQTSVWTEGCGCYGTTPSLPPPTHQETRTLHEQTSVWTEGCGCYGTTLSLPPHPSRDKNLTRTDVSVDRRLWMLRYNTVPPPPTHQETRTLHEQTSVWTESCGC